MKWTLSHSSGPDGLYSSRGRTAPTRIDLPFEMPRHDSSHTEILIGNCRRFTFEASPTESHKNTCARKPPWSTRLSQVRNKQIHRPQWRSDRDHSLQEERLHRIHWRIDPLGEKRERYSGDIYRTCHFSNELYTPPSATTRPCGTRRRSTPPRPCTRSSCAHSHPHRCGGRRRESRPGEALVTSLRQRPSTITGTCFRTGSTTWRRR